MKSSNILTVVVLAAVFIVLLGLGMFFILRALKQSVGFI